MADKVEFVSDEEIPVVESVKSKLDISTSRVCMIVHVLQVNFFLLYVFKHERETLKIIGLCKKRDVMLF